VPDEAGPQQIGSLTPEETVYFRMLAEVDFTKHLGGLKATEELLRMVHVDSAEEMLDVGCGVGLTPAYVAKRYNCRVVGVDIFDGMVQRARERAQREGVQDRTEFHVADIRELPFEAGRFDAVICESVLALVEQQGQAVRELVRVAKPGGYVGISEVTWTTEPSAEVKDYLGNTLGGFLYARTQEGWEQLMVESGLKELAVQVAPVTVGGESRQRMRRLGCRNMARVWWRFLSVALRNREYRSFMRGALSMPDIAFDCWGCGVFVGRK
jgi:ubiquinone/menaquinone biosynthesis C-methylase UbiE